MTEIIDKRPRPKARRWLSVRVQTVCRNAGLLKLAATMSFHCDETITMIACALLQIIWYSIRPVLTATWTLTTQLKNKEPDRNENIRNLKSYRAGAIGSEEAVDRTYNLGSIYCTVTVYNYKNMANFIIRHSSDHPVFAGPLFLYGNSDRDLLILSAQQHQHASDQLLQTAACTFLDVNRWQCYRHRNENFTPCSA